jgi:hypothetical protein
VEALNGVIATIGGETPILRQGLFRCQQLRPIAVGKLHKLLAVEFRLDGIARSLRGRRGGAKPWNRFGAELSERSYSTSAC